MEDPGGGGGALFGGPILSVGQPRTPRHQAAGQWIHYDDDTRRLVGRDFEAVKHKCVAGRLHPQLLFYEGVDGEGATRSTPS